MEEDSLYNAIILALIIGIIIVVATLLLARPKPETFTELYFNNHTTLPSFAQNNTAYPFSFTIANHERTTTTYNYSITKELYSFNYGCEPITLYFDYQNNTRTAISKDPRLYVRDQNYAFTLTAARKTAPLLFTLSFIDQQNKPKYAVTFDEANQVVTLTADQTKSQNVTYAATSNYIRVQVDQSLITVYLNNKPILNITQINPTQGYFQLKTQSYADLSNLIVEVRELKQRLQLSYSDATYEKVPLDKQDILNTNFLLQQSDQNPFIQSIKAEKSFSQSSYSLETSIRIPKSILVYGTEDFQMLFDPTKNTVRYGTPNATTVAIIMPGYSQNHLLRMEVSNTTAKAYIDNTFLGIQNITAHQNKTPFIVQYDPDIQIRSLTLTDLDGPHKIAYSLPGLPIPEYTYAPLTRATVLQNIMNTTQSTLQPSEVQDFVNKRTIDWENYRIRSSYSDENKSQSITYTFVDNENLSKTIYALELSATTNNATFTYVKDKKTLNQTKTIKLNTTKIHSVQVDVNKKQIIITVDGQQLFKELIDKTTQGILVTDTQTDITNLQIENLATSEIKTLRSEEVSCNAFLMNSTQQNATIQIQNQGQAIINQTLLFSQDFDRAKIQISLPNQEIHYWVNKQ